MTDLNVLYSKVFIRLFATCNLCNEILRPPIYICKQLHISCLGCHVPFAGCPRKPCKEPFKKSNLAESIAWCLLYPCPKNCDTFLPFMKLDEHETICRPGKVYPPYYECAASRAQSRIDEETSSNKAGPSVSQVSSSDQGSNFGEDLSVDTLIGIDSVHTEPSDDREIIADQSILTADDAGASVDKKQSVDQPGPTVDKEGNVAESSSFEGSSIDMSHCIEKLSKTDRSPSFSKGLNFDKETQI